MLFYSPPLPPTHTPSPPRTISLILSPACSALLPAPPGPGVEARLGGGGALPCWAARRGDSWRAAGEVTRFQVCSLDRGLNRPSLGSPCCRAGRLWRCGWKLGAKLLTWARLSFFFFLYFCPSFPPPPLRASSLPQGGRQGGALQGRRASPGVRGPAAGATRGPGPPRFPLPPSAGWPRHGTVT